MNREIIRLNHRIIVIHFETIAFQSIFSEQFNSLVTAESFAKYIYTCTRINFFEAEASLFIISYQSYAALPNFVFLVSIRYESVMRSRMFHCRIVKNSIY